jgi:LPS-assembly lipoprotein
MRARAALLCLPLGICSFLLAACGFQLRGSADVPFKTIYVPASAGGIALELRRNILAGTSAKVVEEAKQAEAVLEFLQEAREKEILSLAATGRVREFQLRYRVGFRVHDGKGRDFVPANSVTLVRDITFNDSDVLAKESEEQLLYRDMQSDMVQQIMRRLAAINQPRNP